MSTATHETTDPLSPTIAVHELRKEYADDVVAVNDISFDVQPGEVFGLLGPNGAGKSTTIGMLTTTVRPTGGSAHLVGFDVRTRPLAARRVSAVVFQEAVVDRSLTGRRNLEIHGRLWGLDASTIHERSNELAASFGILDDLDRPVATYSGGERRRLELARALVSGPRVLFLDEPTVGLDPRIRHELLDLIARLQERGDMTVLLTTHYLDEAERLCERVAVMHAGNVVALGRPVDLLAALGSELVELRVADDPQRALSSFRASAIASRDAFAVGATITIPVRDRTARALMDAIEQSEVHVTAITARSPTLDDVYLQLTGRSLAA